MKYIMTEDQLAANGYPCPDPDEKGKAIIKMVWTFAIILIKNKYCVMQIFFKLEDGLNVVDCMGI